jgi:hypothetical protein
VCFADAAASGAYNEVMSDFVFIAVTIVFFAICSLYVKWCDKIIGADEPRSTHDEVTG